MLRNRRRTMRMAGWTLGALLALGGLTLAQRNYGYDYDDGYDRHDNAGQAQQYGYQNGYHDGIGKGRHEGREHDPNDYHAPAWRQSTRGYQRWMGPVDGYQRAYQEGYRNGFRAGYEEVSQRWNGGNRGYDRGYEWQHAGWRSGYGGNGGSVANRFGYEDGIQMAREDMDRHKKYNSKPRGRFGDRDDGYHREFGDKNYYKAEYTAGYRAGYDATYGRY